jgi:pimeloyl-ACP methyl ester carboxylesterase
MDDIREPSGSGRETSRPTLHPLTIAGADALSVYGSGPAIVLVAGWRPDPEKQFGELLRELARKGHAACVVSLTHAARWRSFADAVTQLGDVLEVIGEDDLVLAGHSLGAALIAGYRSLTADSRVGGLALLAPPLPSSVSRREDLALARLTVRHRLASWPLRLHTARAWRRRGLGDYTAREVLDHAVVAVDLFDALPRELAQDLVADPALFVIHTRDETFPLTASELQELRAGPSRRQVVTLDAEHSPDPAAQRTLAALLLEFAACTTEIRKDGREGPCQM